MSAPSRHRGDSVTPSAREKPTGTGIDGPPPTEIRRTLHDCMHKAHSAFKSAYMLDSNNTLPTHKYATTSACGVLRARRTCAVTRRSTHSASTACDRTMRAPVSRPPPERLFMRSSSVCVTNCCAAPTVPKRPGCRPHRVSGGWPQGDIASQSVRKMCEGWEAAHLLPLHADVDLGAARGQRI